MRVFAAVLAGCVLALPGVAGAHTITYGSFGSTAGLTLLGPTATAVDGGRAVLQLIPNVAEEAGGAFVTAPITLNVDGSFQTAFKFQINGVTNDHAWSDGFTFFIAASTAGLPTYGNGGSGLGYAGLNNSLAVEFDTYYSDGDALPNQVAVDTNGNVDTSMDPTNSYGQPYGQGSACANVTGQQPMNCLADGTVWTAHITYSKGLMNVSVQNGSEPMTPVVTNYPVKLLSLLKTHTADVGFTAADGEGYAKFNIIAWQLQY